MAFSITDILGGSLVDSIGKIIDQFHMSPDDKAKLQLAIQQNADAVQQAQETYDTKLNDIAGQNIRAEQTSGDKVVTRARPGVIWVGLGMFVWNYCLVPTVGMHWHVPSLPIPDMFLEIWGVVVTGYVFNRTAEQIMKAPGDSSIKLPFVSLSNKS